MAKSRKYTFNPKTLSYEVSKRSKKARLIRSLAYLTGSLVLATVYFWLYVAVFDLELPKTLILKKKNAEWISRIEVMNRQLDKITAKRESRITSPDNIDYRGNQRDKCYAQICQPGLFVAYRGKPKAVEQGTDADWRFPELSDDSVFDDEICIFDAFHLIHLGALKFENSFRKNTCQSTYIIYNSLHVI